MPGLCGIIESRRDAGLSDRFDNMLNRLRHHSWYRTDQFVDSDAGVALGRVSLGFVQTAPQPAWNCDHTACCFMAGELHGAADTRRRLSASGRSTSESASHADLLLEGFLAEGQLFFRELNGTFVAAIWQPDLRRLTLVTDRFGMKPLYYTHVAGRLLLAAEIKSLLVDPAVSREANPRGIAQFFSFGQLLCEDTMLAGVKTLPAAAWITYDQSTDRLKVDRYWQLRELPFEPNLSQADFHDRIDVAMAAAVRRHTENTESLGMSLSGGLDSRTILALVDHAHVPIKTVSMGVSGGLDHRCAEQLACTTNRDHHRSVLDGQFLASYPQIMQQMVHLTDGQYLDQCIVLPTLPKYQELGIQVLLRGHAGELMHMDKAYNFSLDAAGWAIRDEETLRRWLRRRMRTYMLQNLPGPLFTQLASNELESVADQSLDEALAESAGVTPALHRVWHLFISQRLRRETAMSMAKIGTQFETRLPFLDNEVVAALLAGQPQWKRGDEIQSFILKRHRPEFLTVINANTGVEMGAAAWRARAADFRFRVFAKLGLPGYQPYERLGLWLRRELKPWVEEVLLGSRCSERAMFDQQTVRKVVEHHAQRRANHTALLLAMLIFELGQREFIDGETTILPSDDSNHPKRKRHTMVTT